MIIRDASFPPFRSDLKKAFGYLSFQCSLINVDVIGIRLKKSYEVVIITWRGPQKTGWIYEGEKLTPKQILQLYEDIPEDKNKLEEYEKTYSDKIEILIPEIDNYVFITEKEVQRIERK